MWKINNTTISLVQGNITDCEVDAIVNAANTQLILGGGVAGAIRKMGGSKIQEECSKHGPIELGGVAITSGGNLKAKYVIHAASMELGGKTTTISLTKSIINTLDIANQNKIKSISFPAIGTGIAGFPLVECANIMIKNISSFLVNKEHNFKHIEIVLYSKNDYIIFKEVFGRYFNEFQ